MHLLERNNNNGSSETIKVLERVDSDGHANFVTDEVYSRGLGIQHFLVDAAGNQSEIMILTDCPAQKPFIAIADIY